MISRRMLLVSAAVLASPVARAQQVASGDIPIGVLYPFTGAGAQVGVDARYALETAVDIINNVHDLICRWRKRLGLPKLNGAKIRLVFADHQANPQKGRTEAERLINQEGRRAALGTYYSSVASVVSQVAERYQIPFIAAESSSPSLHRTA